MTGESRWFVNASGCEIARSLYALLWLAICARRFKDRLYHHSHGDKIYIDNVVFTATKMHTKMQSDHDGCTQAGIPSIVLFSPSSQVGRVIHKLIQCSNYIALRLKPFPMQLMFSICYKHVRKRLSGVFLLLPFPRHPPMFVAKSTISVSRQTDLHYRIKLIC